MKYLRFDVMLDDRFIATMKMECKPHPILVDGELINIDMTEESVREFVEGRLPSLKGKDFKIAF